MFLTHEIGHTTTMRYNGEKTPLTTGNLLDAYAEGAFVSLYSVPEGTFLRGTIQGIANERYSHVGAAPRHLIVSIRMAEGPLVDLYVHTIG